jgi:hypothetical protein
VAAAQPGGDGAGDVAIVASRQCWRLQTVIAGHRVTDGLGVQAGELPRLGRGWVGDDRASQLPRSWGQTGTWGSTGTSGSDLVCSFLLHPDRSPCSDEEHGKARASSTRAAKPVSDVRSWIMHLEARRPFTHATE